MRLQQRVPIDRSFARKKVFVLFAVIVVNVRAVTTRSRIVSKRCHSRRRSMCVAAIEAEAQIVQVRLLNELLQRMRGAPSSPGVFSSAIVTPRCLAKTTRCSSELKAASSFRAPSAALPAYGRCAAPEIAERNTLGHFERALHFVHRVHSADALGITNGDGHAALAAGRKVSLGGGMQGMQRPDDIRRGRQTARESFARHGN